MYCGRPAPKETSINRPGNGLKIRCLVFPLGSCAKKAKKIGNGRQMDAKSRKSAEIQAEREKGKPSISLGKSRVFSMELLAGLEPATC